MDWTTSIKTYTDTDVSHQSNVTVQTAALNIRYDPNLKIATIWGRFATTSTTGVETQLLVQTDLRPPSRIEMTPCGVVYGADGNGKMNGNFAVNSAILRADGMFISRSVNWYDQSSNNRMVSTIFPTTFILT